MGASKLTLPYGDSTVIGTVVARLSESCVDDAVLVTGYHAEKVEKAIDGAVATTRNPDPDKGNLSSLQCGVSELDARVEGVLVVVGDMPGVDTDVINRLVEQFASSAVDAVVPVYTDGWGHPIVVVRELITQLDPSADKPLWRTIRDLPDDDRIEMVVNKPKPIDINTPADHHKAMPK